MTRRNGARAKKSLVVDSKLLREWVAVGGYRSESEAVRAAVSTALAIRRLQEAIAGIQARGTFGRRLG
jgi:Arc/MetJ-type ribon-helix-helix transcriptional regulator